MITTSQVAEQRTVFTYAPDGVNIGVITGYTDLKDATFVVEHVIVFPNAPLLTLARMVRAGLEEAWTLDYQGIVFCLPDDFAPGPALARLGTRLGFVAYAREKDLTWWVKWRVP